MGDLDEIFIARALARMEYHTIYEKRKNRKRKHSKPLVISKLSGSPEEKLLKVIFRRW